MGAGSNKTAEIHFSVAEPIEYLAIDLLRFDWEMKYISTEYPGFALQGKYQIEVKNN